jgi:hypothetical protein
MLEAGMEKTMDEILEQVQREYAEQGKQEAPTCVGARDAAHNTSNGSPKGLPSWERLTPNEIEQARQHVARERAAVLSRQAAELKELDTQQDEIDQLERVIAAFSQKHGASRQSRS